MRRAADERRRQGPADGHVIREVHMLDRLGDFLFGRTGDRITKVGIVLCGAIIIAELIGKII